MFWFRISWFAFAGYLAAFVEGQQSGWADDQVNATMCAWKASRVAKIRDTVYIDGGYLYWAPGMADGSYGAPTQDNNPLGLIYTLNFSTPFNTSANISEVLNVTSKAPNGNAANNFAPNYYDGAILANDNEFFLYGGLLRETDVYSSPDADEVLGYQLFQYGAPKESWFPGFVNERLDDGVTRYITYGGAASSPSENKGWYFGGMRSASGGPIYYPGSNESLNPLNVSNTLITLDMATQTEESWSNSTLPASIKGRANPDLVWVPVGEQGILVAIGGVIYPDFNNPIMLSQNEAQSRLESPEFMSTIDIYDIAGNKWYKQNTTDGPGQLTQGCAVVAPAQDYSSYNIYYYGGYDGLHANGDFNDDVWILSLPSFIWIKVSSGRTAHARAGHQCVMPYPDQMMVIGGYASLKGVDTQQCLQGGIIQMFNLTEGKWVDSYDPASWAPYGVPETIYATIGGTETGGATMTTPLSIGWATTELASVFATPYPTSKITTYYPYASIASITHPPDVSSGGGGTQPWVAPVLGVVLGLVFISVLVVAILVYRRRKLLKRGGMSAGGTDENGYRIISWIRGQDSNKAPTVTTDDTAMNSDDVESRIEHAQPHNQARLFPDARQGPEMASVRPHEMSGTALAELMDTSSPAELGDTGLSPIDIINKHSHFARTPHSASTPTNPSAFSQSNYTVSQDHTSVSSVTGTVPSTPPTPVLVSAAPMSPEGGGAPSPLLPVSPPTADEQNATDYMSVHGQSLAPQEQQEQQEGLGGNTSSPLRKSVFYESAEDLGDMRK
ncbi:uncharacterized protein BCR38DRAFT_186468 [Pseudomassariella vexata]|uniref:Kelch repeat protein n=1 Tax=Pseudomassariella vexata TaxID=1141098 RepID=A0A1Y2E0K9_9PEZI|nr:uncharacterized protein BCR38DRAFT_186468 [Pseudomassariella vexata]ORY64886.1 hypothetical protein BCR38DRAFT_186468 [Pseudomassariella vexata]